MKRPLVSVLIPCFNAERFIGETIESVLRQTWSKIEIIVVNDGSTDNSVSEVRRFSNSRLRLADLPHTGAAASRNEAFRLSKGEFIQYLDADDLISPCKIERQMQRLATNRKCVASADWGRFYASYQEAIFGDEKMREDLSPLDWLAISRGDGLGMMLPALWLIPRSIVFAAGPWNEDVSVGDDTEFFTRVLLLCEKVLFCEGARCFYRSGIKGSLSGRRSIDGWRSQFKVTQLCQEYVLGREDSDRIRRGFAQSWQHFAHACYPYHRGMALLALNKAKTLHSVKFDPDGGPVFRNISRLLGWKIARIMQVAAGWP